MVLPRPPRAVKLVFAILLAFIASIRGGLVLACEAANGGEMQALTMEGEGKGQGHDMSSHGMPPSNEGTSHEGEPCDSPEGTQDCALMAACTPAIATVADGDAHLVMHAPAIASVGDAPSATDRSPDPPPPRS